jgi:uncharacterized coiled-coil protein SlyX
MEKTKMNHKEIEKVLSKLNETKLKKEDGSVKVRKLEEKMKKIVEDLIDQGFLEEDPAYYEGIWINNVQKARRKLEDN